MATPVARNAPCPCGSGRRFKDCHGALDAHVAPDTSLAALEKMIAESPGDARRWLQALGAIVRDHLADSEIGNAYALGEARPLRVAVVTAYAREDLALVRRAHESVLGQTYACRHFLVADGFPRAVLDEWSAEHLKLERPHHDYGDTPRAAGGRAAADRGFDAVAYLDADNMFRPRHIETLVSRQQATAAAVCYSGRTFHLPDGTLVPRFDPEDVGDHVDTNCLFITRTAFSMLSAWTGYPRHMAIIGDRIFRRMLLARGFSMRCTGAMTVRYTVNQADDYVAAGRPVPDDARPPFDFRPMLDWYGSQSEAARDAIDQTLGFELADLLRHVPGIH